MFNAGHRPSNTRMLDNARAIAGIPFKINCAYRTKDWDLAKGRSGRSAHTEGKAVDIPATFQEAIFWGVSIALPFYFGGRSLEKYRKTNIKVERRRR